MNRSLRKPTVLSLLAVLAAVAACPPVPEPLVRYICFGDSVTQGAPTGSYPAFLDGLLAGAGLEVPGSVANQGQFGEVACGSQGRLRERLDPVRYPGAHTVLYWEGANDLMLYVYEANHALDHGPTPADLAEIDLIAGDCIGQALDIIRLEEGLDAVIGTYYDLVPGVNVYGWGETTPEMIAYANLYVDAMNAAVLNLAAAEGVPIAPIHTLGVLGDGSAAYYLEDGAHPNAEGYRLIAQVWFEAIAGLP